MHKRFLLLAALFAGLSAAQTVPLTLNSITNGDIVTLAKAGFNEDFIVDFIAASRTRFDISVNGLAELARSGLSERLIRAMLAAGEGPQPISAPAAVAPQALPMPAMSDTLTPVRSRKMSEPAMAMSTQTPYYHSSTFLWGLIHKQVKIYATPQSDRQVFPQLGSAFGQVRLLTPMTMAPVFQGTRYVVVP